MEFGHFNLHGQNNKGLLNPHSWTDDSLVSIAVRDWSYGDTSSKRQEQPFRDTRSGTEWR